MGGSLVLFSERDAPSHSVAAADVINDKIDNDTEHGEREDRGAGRGVWG